MMSLNILAVEDDESSQRLIKDILLSEGYTCKIAGSADKAKRLLEESPECNMAVLDLGIPDGDKDYQSIEKGFSLLEYISNTYPLLYIIVLTASDRIEHSVRAMKLGAYDYLTKPIDLEILKKKLNQVRQIITLKEENIKLRQGTEFGKIIGESEEINRLLSTILKVAPTDAAVLIQGETGAGKELVAEAIHKNSLRNEGPFIPVDCTRKDLIESELFGHEKGTFTGAINQRKGKFEIATNGTIFLDEIGEIPIDIQANLLRVIQEKQFMRLGGNELITIDVRVISATKHNLRLKVKEGTFRDDLFFRINTITLKVPTLNERKSDISIIVNHFLEKYSKGKKKITSSAMAKLINYGWAGNVRQLQNVIERSCILAGEKDVLDVKDIIFDDNEITKKYSEFEELLLTPLRQSKEEFEKRYLENALKQHDNNKSKAAKSTGLDKSNFHKLLKKHNLI